MKGWWLLVMWKDQSTSRVPLKDLKVSNPVELAEYAVANRIAEERAFTWWVSDTLHIISKVKKKYWRMTHKFGVKLPHSVEEVLEIDRVTGMDLWRKALNKEMSKIWFKGGLKCGANKGKVCVVVHALYGLKSVGVSWRWPFLQVLHDIGFSSVTADPDNWI
jgi:hypothetical protein